MLLLDRDGTLVKRDMRHRYLYGDHEFELLPDVADCLRSLQQRGVSTAICTNQQGVSLPEFPDMTIEAVERFHARLNQKFASFGVEPLRFFVCPHNGDDQCQCRKPAPGLLQDAMVAHNVRATESWFVGDQLTDMLAAKRAAVQPVYLSPEDTETIDDGVVGVGNWQSICRLQRLGFTSAYPKDQLELPVKESTDWIRLNQVAYDGIAESYVAKTSRFASIEQDFISRLYRTHLRGSEDGFIVDCGCGPARDAEFLLRFGWMYLGVDNSKGMLSVAAARLRPLVEGNWALLNANMLSFDLPEQSVAFFVCNSSIQHIDSERLKPWLRRIRSFLRRNGLLYLHFRVGHGKRKEWSYEYKQEGICRLNFYHRSDDLSDLLKGLGFEIVLNEQYVTDYEKDDVCKKTQVPWMCRIVAKKV